MYLTGGADSQERFYAHLGQADRTFGKRLGVESPAYPSCLIESFSKVVDGPKGSAEEDTKFF
jgi:hypothetical protein